MNKNGITSLSVSVPTEFRARYNKPKQFWSELGDFFVDLVAQIDGNAWAIIKEKYPNPIDFIQEMLPECPVN